MKRHDPAVEAPVDGAPDHSAVAGKDPRFWYFWAHRNLDADKLLHQTSYKGVRIQPYVKVRADEDNGEEFAGYGSIRSGEAPSTDIVNGEHVLLKRPIEEQMKVWAANEEESQRQDFAIHGDSDLKKAPVTVDVTDKRVASPVNG